MRNLLLTITKSDFLPQQFPPSLKIAKCIKKRDGKNPPFLSPHLLRQNLKYSILYIIVVHYTVYTYTVHREMEY